MPVIISEFEVVPEPEREPAAVQEHNSREKVAPPPAAQDVARIVQLLTERALRAWAD